MFIVSLPETQLTIFFTKDLQLGVVVSIFGHILWVAIFILKEIYWADAKSTPSYS